MAQAPICEGEGEADGAAMAEPAADQQAHCITYNEII